MKKPDAITIISPENYKEKVWPLPASDLLYVGRATDAKLSRYGIHTIGDIAATDPIFLKGLLGVNGLALWRYASGTDTSRVMQKDFVSPIKSVGHGITCSADLMTEEEVWRVMLELAQDLGHRLRVHQLMANGVQICIRSSELGFCQYQRQLELPTRSPLEIAWAGRELLHANYTWSMPIRAVTIRGINLTPQNQPEQTTLFIDTRRRERRDKLETAVEEIRRRYGKKAVYAAILMGDMKMPGDGREMVRMPGLMFQ